MFQSKSLLTVAETCGAGEKLFVAGPLFGIGGGRVGGAGREVLLGFFVDCFRIDGGAQKLVLGGWGCGWWAGRQHYGALEVFEGVLVVVAVAAVGGGAVDGRVVGRLLIRHTHRKVRSQIAPGIPGNTLVSSNQELRADPRLLEIGLCCNIC